MKISYIRRYTSLPYLLDVLHNRKLTLSDPKNWEDQNDSFFIELYKNRLGYKSILALCFTESNETFHHWKVYSANASGVCIQFMKRELISYFNRVDGIRHEKVIYKKAGDILKNVPRLESLPFIKRVAFKDEKEYRFIYENISTEMTTKDVPIELSSISSVIINPWMPKSVCNSVKNVIRKIEGCSSLRVIQTSLVNNDLWKSAGSRVIP